jgi:putative Holliday junction resolvase
MSNKIDINTLKGKRLAAVDFGMKRLGLAVCDQFHVTISPRDVYDYSSKDFWDKFVADLNSENLAAVIVGVPKRLDGEKTKVIVEIEKFIELLRKKTQLQIIEHDESFTSQRAVETMVTIGKKKNKRSQKGETDKVAAAIILRDFLNEYEGGFYV